MDIVIVVQSVGSSYQRPHFVHCFLQCPTKYSARLKSELSHRRIEPNSHTTSGHETINRTATARVAPHSTQHTGWEPMKDYPLTRYGQEMTPEPMNTRIHLVQIALHQGVPIRAVIEPGDATRYELVVTNLFTRGIIVTRIDGTHSTTVHLDGMDANTREDLIPLCNRNHWTQEVLYWWLTIAMDVEYLDEDGDIASDPNDGPQHDS